MREDRSVVFTGGGTAGHVFPGLSVWEALRKRWRGRIVWIGSRTGIERRLLGDIPYVAVPTGKWRRYLSLRNYLDPFKVLAGFLRSLVFLRREKPLLLFSKGGYVSVPPVLAARALGIPVFSHESDCSVGLATRINARCSERIFVSFPQTEFALPAKYRQRVLLVGNPVRQEILEGDPEEGRRFLGCPKDMPILLVLGGSQGAVLLNRLLVPILDRLQERCFVVHQTGGREKATREKRYYRCAFIRDELPHLMAAADLAVTRAGAATLSELAAVGLPAVLVPLPLSSSRGDQIVNAEFFAGRGAAVIFNQEGGKPQQLLAVIEELLDSDSKRQEMEQQLRILSHPEAASEIARFIEERIQR